MFLNNSNLLSNEEILTQLVQDGYSEELVESIIQIFWIHDWGNSFISIKEHFQALQKFLVKEKPTHFSRFDFYTFFFTDLIVDYENLSESLQKIAIVFELMQTDHMEINEFEHLRNELNLSKSVSLQALIDHQLITIITEEDKQIAKWVHHTITEYLSAVYILKQNNVIKAVDKFMCNSEIGTKVFIPSWNGTLRFLIEKNPEIFINWLEACLEINSDFLNDQLTEVMVFETPVSVAESSKTKLFHLIYDSYQQKKWWIPVWAYHNLYKFIDSGTYKILKENAKNNNPEYRGNIAAILDGMLRKNHPLLTSEEKDFWKKILIEYANEEYVTGVLQRHSLAALENFAGDISIIEAVSINANSTDTLVREAFINLCRKIDPNSPLSIEFFIKGISEDTSHIYARNALYSVSTPEGIKTLLESTAENRQFIHEFLDKESIFNKEEKQNDSALIDNIQRNMNTEIATLIKKFIFTAFVGERNYHAGDSYFIRQLTLLIKAQDPNYLNEIISTIMSLSQEEKNRLFINEFEGVLSVLLEVGNLERLKGIFNDTLHPHSGYTFAEAIRLAIRNNNPEGEAILQKGVELGIIADPEKLPKYDDNFKKRELEIYKQFKKYLLPPTKGQYFPQVFGFFVENQKLIETQISEVERKRLLELAIDSNLNKIDPGKIVVRYKSESKTGEYTISSIASYFVDVLRLIHKLKPRILQTPKNRRKVIEFIPFAYTNDFKIIQDILGTVSDKEIITLNRIMMNKKNDARYLIPQTYIYFTKVFPNLKTPKKVLLSFVTDKYINESDKIYALETLGNYISKEDKLSENLLLNIWHQGEQSVLSNSANALLISIFHNEAAISWRFQKIIDSAKPFHRPQGVHAVGDLEMELNNLAFAEPLIELKDEKYLETFIKLLDFSLTLNPNEEYREYTNYLWRIAIAFVVRDNFFLSEAAYQRLKEWANANKETPNVNWFNKRLEIALTESKSSRTRKNKVSEAIAVLNV